MMLTKIVTLVLALVCGCIHCEDEGFADPPFSPGPPDKRVTFGEFIPNAGQPIDMDELITDNITIALVNCKGDDPMPVIGDFEDNKSNAFLGAVLRQRKTKLEWELIITKKQDAQSETMENYRFNIRVSEDEIMVLLNIRHIVHTKPIIISNQVTCQFKEFNTGETDCTYTVQDADGFVGDLTYGIQASDPDIFSLMPLPSESKYERVLQLGVEKELDVDQAAFVPLNLTATNAKQMVGFTAIVLEVLNVPHRPPKWVTIFATQKFPEKQKQTFHVLAVDGDIQIQSEINYEVTPKIATEDFFHINKKTGVLTIDKIDRDALKKEIFELTLYAYKKANKTSRCEQEVMIIVEDVNDNSPLVQPPHQSIVINEEEYMTLEFPEPITISDIDLGKNAEYTVLLRDQMGKNKWYEAFILVPNRGYQDGVFTISVANATKLDYEDLNFQNITLEIVATEVEMQTHIGVGSVNIQLLNLNDELPEFTPKVTRVAHYENLTENALVATMLAIDRDILDHVEYSIVDTTQPFKIDKMSGEVRTTIPKALDHEVQKEVIIQVMATDTFIDNIRNETHQVQTQLIITVKDVNDKPPKIQMDGKSVSINENVPSGTSLDIQITASDPDTSAWLEFNIDWDNSRATKQGRDVPQKLYKKCFKIETKFKQGHGNAAAVLTVQEISKGKTLDYEAYDMIYLAIFVTDLNQTMNEDTDTGTIPIIINDLNDNAPIFNVEVTNAYKMVKDKADTDTVIGSVLATDADGTEFNHVTYNLVALDIAQEGLVLVDEERGEMRVADTIDCDEPNMWYNLKYNVSATDCINIHGDVIQPCFTTHTIVTIYIDDVNNQYPQVEELENGDHVTIPEKSETGQKINQIHGHDKDRNVTFKTISYDINTWEHEELRNLFSVDNNGVVIVNLTGKEILDRDYGPSEYMIYVQMLDNKGGIGGSLSTMASFTLILEDINDKYPSYDFPTELLIPAISENAKKGDELTKIHAYDEDDPTTNNTLVEYGIAWAHRTDDPDDSKDYQDLFEVQTNKDHVTGQIKLKKDLKNLFGEFTLNLTVRDWGTPRLENSSIFSLTIEKYSFDAPIITRPKADEKLLLQKPKNIDDPLVVYGSESGFLQPFTANDNFDGRKWVLTFTIEPADIFSMKPMDESTASLFLKKLPTELKYDCTLTVTDNGRPSQMSTKVSFVVYFIDVDSVPTFEKKNAQEEFLENTNGTLTNKEIPKADDPKSDLTGIPIKYFITGGDDDGHFDLIDHSRTLHVVKPLDLQVQAFHDLLIQASVNNEPVKNPDPDSLLQLRIKVLVVNSHAPTFDRPLYLQGITVNNKPGDTIQTLKGHDVDVNDTLRYAYVVNSLVVSDHSLDGVINDDDAFLVDEDSGAVSLNFKVQPDMKGFFTFDVQVFDAVDHQASASVNVYVIAEDNKVTFKFENPVEYVTSLEYNISQVFSDMFKADCSIDSIIKDVENSRAASDVNKTAVETHFIDDNVPVEGETIKVAASDVDTYYSLREQFQAMDLEFTDVYRGFKEEVKDMAELLQTILIIVAAILGTLCVVLFIAFIVRTRTLNKRLMALSTTKFGSQASNLNRAGMPAPNTNQHAIEGSNPVWGDDLQMDFDNRSIGSGDSNLVGVEDSEAFNGDTERRASYNPVMREELRRQSFNPTVMATDMPEQPRTSFNPLANPNHIVPPRT